MCIPQHIREKDYSNSLTLSANKNKIIKIKKEFILKKTITKTNPKNYRRIKIKNRNYPNVSSAIRSLLLRKNTNLEDTSVYHEIADLCKVTYPLVSQLAHEMRKEVKIGKSRFENVVDATENLSKKYPMEHIASLCKVSQPCIEMIIKVRKLSQDKK